MQNPQGPNENFQESEVRKYAEAIYDSTEKKLVAAILEVLGRTEDKDEEGNPIVYTFDYAYRLLNESGYALNHRFVESQGKASLEIKIYKEFKSFSYDVKTSFSASIN